MRALKRIALIPNLTKNGAYEESLKAIRLLKSFGGKILMTADLSEKYSDNDIASFFALNDAVISRGSMTKIIDLDVWLKKSYICHYRADGLIVSTPTGSSAYALSAGGPVIEPSMSCILMTPICSHSLFSRPVLFNPSSEILVNAASREDTDLTLTIDGETTIPITADDTVVITTAEIYAELIVLKDKTFYRVLSDKFTERGL